MTKEEKEKWIIQQFITLSERTSSVYELVEVVSQTRAPGPDFILQDNSGKKLGIEVSELIEFPSTKNKEQRIIQDAFEAKLSQAMKVQGLDVFSVCFHKYTLEWTEINSHVLRIVELLKEVKSEIISQPYFSYEGWIKRVQIDGRSLLIQLHPASDGPSITSFMFGDEGVEVSDRENWIKGLTERLADKEKSARNYLSGQPNWLLLYDNTHYGIFISDISEISLEMKSIHSDYFSRIILLKGDCLFVLYDLNGST